MTLKKESNQLAKDFVGGLWVGEGLGFARGFIQATEMAVGAGAKLSPLHKKLVKKLERERNEHRKAHKF